LKKILNTLIINNNLVDVEKHIFYTYLNQNKIKYDKSKILKKYFHQFKLDEKLFNNVTKLNIDSFRDLEKSQELLIPQIDRKINGTFFTPKNIVRKIIEEVNPQPNDKCSDISCGCGSFLIGLIKYYQLNYKKTINDILKQNIFGYDILNYNIRRTKILISIFGLENNEIVNEENFNLEVCDSLNKIWKLSFDIIVGNPPYVKYQDLNETQRKFLLENFETIQKGTFNLYFSFFELGFNLLKDKGKLGYITPNNYFTSLSGEPLRSFFQKNKSIEKIIDFNSKKVFDVLTYTCLTFLNKEDQEVIKFNKYFNGDFDTYIDNYNKNLSNISLKNLKQKKWRLLLEKDQKNIEIIENIGKKLSELFTINVGIATLRDDLYFLDGKDVKGHFKLLNNNKYYIDSELVKSIYKISDFKGKNRVENNERKIIFPYKVSNNKSNIIDEDTLKKDFPNTYKYFIQIKNELLARSKKTILKPFFQYGRSQGLNKFGIRLLTPTFSQKPNFLIVKEKDSLYCNGYGIHYNSDQNRSTLFDIYPIQKSENIDVLGRILNSNIMDYYIKTTSVTIDGGYPCYQKNFIELFTIPDIDENKICELRNLNSSEFDDELMEIYKLNLEL